MSLLVEVYVLVAAIYLASQLADAARGRSELSIGTAIITVVWPAWVIVFVTVLAWAFVATLLEDRR